MTEVKLQRHRWIHGTHPEAAKNTHLTGGVSKPPWEPSMEM
jgi:hypothetical protein